MDNIREFIKPIKRIESFDELENELNREECLTMCSSRLFDFLDQCIPDLAAKGIHGDFVEAGVWKGGVGIYMKYLQKQQSLQNKLWLYDTFGGFPVTPSEQHPKDLQMFNFFSTLNIKAPDVEEVKNNFRKADLFDDKVVFVKGNILNTLKENVPETLSLLFIDLDFAELTSACLQHLYPKLEEGGVVIIDDYGVDAYNCREAVDSYRKQNLITNKIHYINDRMIYWYK